MEVFFRWLRSPFTGTRDCSRSILQNSSDPALLRRVASRLEAENPDLREQEYAVYRHLKWEMLPVSDLRNLRGDTLLRLAGYLELAGDAPKTTAIRHDG